MKTTLKRIAAPKTWPILRKETTFITRPLPSGLPLELTLPISVVLREILNLVETTAQAKNAMQQNDIRVNGKRLYKPKSAVGFMDVVSIGKDNYLVTINKNNLLTLIPAKDQTLVQKIAGKTTLKGKKSQLSTTSGRTLLVDKDSYKVGDSVVIKDGKVADHLPLKEGTAILITGGSHIGSVGTVKKIEGNTITFATTKNEYETAKRYAYPIGKDKPLIQVA